MKYSTLFFFLFLPSFVIGQNEKYFETGFLFGATIYSGDMTRKVFELKETNPGFGAYARYQFANWFSTKAHVFAGSVSGDDKHDPILKSRSLRFSSSLVELGATAEVNLFAKPRFSKTGIHQFGVVPYFYAGLGAAFINPEAEYYGPADMRNENLRVPLPEVSGRQILPIVPLGVGVRFDVSELLVIGAEGSFRPVFSDLLDAVKVNGNPRSNDWYYYGGLTASFILSKPKYK